MNSTIEATPGGGTAFVGKDAVKVYQATVVASGLRFYHKTGMRLNRAYTPTNMMRIAADITGEKYKVRDYLKAADDLTEWARASATIIHAKNDKGAA